MSLQKHVSEKCENDCLKNSKHVDVLDHYMSMSS
ncbi:hypothetical protein LINPERHAP1_LOCUS40773, partial [Linum perenne]